MTSIDPTSKLLVYLREQAQALRHRAAAAPHEAAGRTAGPPPRRPEEQLALDIESIARDDPQAGRKAFRLYLESVLLRELGPSLANDPGFGALVSRVQSAMESDGALKPAVDEAGALLLSHYPAS